MRRVVTWFVGWWETLAILASPGSREALREAEDAVRAGDLVPFEEDGR